MDHLTAPLADDQVNVRSAHVVSQANRPGAGASVEPVANGAFSAGALPAFSPEQISQDGLEVLENVGCAPRFNAWMMSQLTPHLGRRVLEAGSGIGNLTSMLADRDRVVGVDMEHEYVERLRRRFARQSHLAFHQANLEELPQCAALVREQIDTVLCVNVLEHVADDRRALQHFYDVLQPGGVAVLLVPAHPWLYSKVDAALGHFRRYTEWELASKMATAGFQIVHTGWFNRLGMIGWAISGKILRRRTLSKGQMQLYERLFGLAQRIERIGYLPALSLIAVGRK